MYLQCERSRGVGCCDVLRCCQPRTKYCRSYLTPFCRLQATGAILSPKDVTDCSFLDASANWCDGAPHWAKDKKGAKDKTIIIIAVVGGVLLCAITVYLLIRCRRASSSTSSLLTDYSAQVGSDGKPSSDLPPLPVL
jgi:hypothetical protein